MSEGTLTLPRPSAPQPLLWMLPDDRLAKMAAEGSAPAFATIYARHHQQMYRYCRSILGSEHDARDALQNTMEKAFRALTGETREIALRPWLFRIAHNESVSLLRSRSAATSIEQAERELPAAAADPEARQRLRELMADLELLTPRQRGALVMRELSGLEFFEIGAALETSPEGAKQAVYEARVALHELMAGREMTCDEIRRKISSEDRRLLRGRRVRAHLRTCDGCRSFKQAVATRKNGLAAIAPPLPAPAAVAILEGIVGGGGGIGGALAGGGGIAGALGGGAMMKAGAAGLAALAVGAGVYTESRVRGGSSDAGTGQEQVSQAAPGAARDGSHGSASAAGNGSQGATEARGGGNDAPSPTGEGGQAGGAGGGGSSGAADAAAGGEAAAPAGEAGTPAPAAQDAGASSENGGGPAGTPPGQGGTPPGQGGVPPGLGGVPPGQGGANPGQGGGPPITPPGLGGANPGQGGGPPITPPGLGGANPGQGGGPPITPPGQGGANPGQGGGPPSTPPGQGG